MKRFLILTAIVMTASFSSPVTSLAGGGVSCPIQPKSQKKINNIFISFFQKDVNVGKYIPRNLVLVDPSYVKNGGARCLTRQTYEAFINMDDALFNETNHLAIITSAWRSTKTQQYFANTRSEFAAIPGRSEHQLGTAVDLDVLGSKEEDLFANSIVYQWMLLHASEYGFVQSFNAQGQVSTGIPDEAWHWRFVGKDIATKVTTEKLNINEYLYQITEANKIKQ